MSAPWGYRRTGTQPTVYTAYGWRKELCKLHRVQTGLWHVIGTLIYAKTRDEAVYKYMNGHKC